MTQERARQREQGQRQAGTSLSLEQREKCLLNLCVPVIHATLFEIYIIKKICKPNQNTQLLSNKQRRTRPIWHFNMHCMHN